MTLLWFVNELSKQGRIGPVRAIFVNHHTRAGQKGDEKVVRSLCDQEGIPLEVLHVEGLSALDSNFEAKARKLRRDLCLNNLQKNELLWVGHHLDDSFEWNFMQRNRSTNPRSMIGIPVRNNALIRPFLCVTRPQITKLSKFEGIPFREDPTNFDLKHDRNFIRHKIVPLIRERYPKYLKFYASVANFSAMMLKVSIVKKGRPSHVYVYESGAVLRGKHFSEVQIQELLHTYSNTDRGEINTPIQRMLLSIDNGKKGPFQFSGGVDAYSTHGLLMIYQRRFKNNDEAIAKVLTTLTKETLRSLPSYKKIEFERAWKNLLQTSDALQNLPGLVLVMESDSLCKTLNTSVYDALFPAVSQVCKEKGLRFMTFQKCLDVWMQKKEKLPEMLKLVPLSSLSNLFPSQQ
jgi:tRNA(Ile)-lysidine synthetase-like protein